MLTLSEELSVSCTAPPTDTGVHKKMREDRTKTTDPNGPRNIPYQMAPCWPRGALAA